MTHARRAVEYIPAAYSTVDRPLFAALSPAISQCLGVHRIADAERRIARKRAVNSGIDAHLPKVRRAVNRDVST